MGIHWFIWLIIGVGMTVWSYQLGERFVLFYYLGFVFAIVGFAKLLIGFMLRPQKEQAAPQHVKAPHPGIVRNMAHPAHMQHPAVPPRLRQTLFQCPRCYAQVGPASRFCEMCGLRVR